MDEFLKEVEAYAARCTLHPSTVIQRAGAGGGNTWVRWLNGGGCSMHTADRIRAYINANPPKLDAQDGAAA